jgi:hypothetical protein
MGRLRELIPRRPPDTLPIDYIPVVLGAADLAVSLGGWAIIGATALETSELTVFGAIIGCYMGLGAPYQEAKEEVTWQGTREGYSLGVVMGADGVSAKKGASYFGHRYFAKNEFLLGGAQAQMEGYRNGLLSGYRDGKELTRQQRIDLWRDLRNHGESLPGWYQWDGITSEDTKQWHEKTWKDYYEFFAAVFRKFHMDN